MDSDKAKIKRLEENLKILLFLIDFHAQANFESNRDYIDVILDEINFIQQEIAKIRSAMEDES